MSVFCHAIEDEADLSTEENSRRSSFVAPPSTRLQLTFDFHRLNILLLRAVVQDSVVVGRKVATVTLSHAKINAGVGEFSKYLFKCGVKRPIQWYNLTKVERSTFSF